MIELDRRGGHDLIQYSGATRLCSDEFALMIEGYGFKRATGTFTDVNKFKGMRPQIEMCNLSIGYYNPHTDNEYLDTVEFNDIVDRVEKILRECTGTYVDNQKDEPKHDPEISRWRDSYDNYTPRCCENCGGLISGKGVRSKAGYLCCDETCAAELDKYFMEDDEI